MLSLFCKVHLFAFTVTDPCLLYLGMLKRDLFERFSLQEIRQHKYVFHSFLRIWFSILCYIISCIVCLFFFQWHFLTLKLTFFQRTKDFYVLNLIYGCLRLKLYAHIF